MGTKSKAQRCQKRANERALLVEKELTLIAQQYGLEVDGGVQEHDTVVPCKKSLTSKNKALKKRRLERESKRGRTKKSRSVSGTGSIDSAAALLQPLLGDGFEHSACGFPECDCRGTGGKFVIGSNRRDLQSHACVDCGHSIAQHTIVPKRSSKIDATKQFGLVKLARLSISSFSAASWCSEALAALGDVCRRNGDSSTGKFLAKEIRPLVSVATRSLWGSSGPKSKVELVVALDEMYYRLYYHYLTNSNSRDECPIPAPDSYFEDLESWAGDAIGFVDNFFQEELNAATQTNIKALWETDGPSNSLLKIFNYRFAEGVRLFYETGLGMNSEMETAVQAGKPKKWTKKTLTPPPCYPTLQKWRDICRDWCCHLYSFAIPSKQALKVMEKFAPLIEVGGGVGYWAALLKAKGVDIEVYDKNPTISSDNEYHGRVTPFVEVKEGGPDVLQEMEDRTLFLCYPPPRDAMARDCLELFKGKHIIHVGEWEGDTGNRKFEAKLVNSFQLVEKVPLPNWGNTSCHMTVWMRKSADEAEDKVSQGVMLKCSNCGCNDFSVLRTCSICRFRIYCGTECMEADAAMHREEHSLRMVHLNEPLNFDNPLHFYRCYRGTVRNEIETRQAKKKANETKKVVCTKKKRKNKASATEGG